MREACDGFGVDRLLLGMKLTALEKGIEIPDIYKDPAFSRSNHWLVSTSQLSSDGFYVGFGAVEEDGFGVCYSIRDDMITMTVSALDNPATSVDKFCKGLGESLMEMKEMCEAGKAATAKL